MTTSAPAIDMTQILEAARQHVNDAPLPATPAPQVAANENTAPKAPAPQAPVAANSNHAPLPEGVTAIHGKHTEALGHNVTPMTAEQALQNAATLYAKAAVCFAGLAQELQKQAANSPQQPQR